MDPEAQDRKLGVLHCLFFGPRLEASIGTKVSCANARAVLISLILTRKRNPLHTRGCQAS